MESLLTYIIRIFKKVDSGTLPSYDDPGDPPDIGDPLTQDEIDFVKRLKKEVDERFEADDAPPET